MPVPFVPNAIWVSQHWSFQKHLSAKKLDTDMEKFRKKDTRCNVSSCVETNGSTDEQGVQASSKTRTSHPWGTPERMCLTAYK